MKFKILLVLVLAMFMVPGFTWADDDDDGHRCGFL